jgi:hypothetical protein
MNLKLSILSLPLLVKHVVLGQTTPPFCLSECASVTCGGTLDVQCFCVGQYFALHTCISTRCVQPKDIQDAAVFASSLCGTIHVDVWLTIIAPKATTTSASADAPATPTSKF